MSTTVVVYYMHTHTYVHTGETKTSKTKIYN